MIYLDYNASTPIDPAVKDAMLPYLDRLHGNPSSTHALGRQVKAGVEMARQQVATMLGAEPGEIIFTSGGTESNNMVLKGVAHTKRKQGRHIITSKVEHPAIINPCKHLESMGCEISYVGVDAMGRVDPQEVAEEVRPDTILISIMLANNEVGTIQPIREIAEMAREGGVWMHTDAAQACAKIETDVNALGVDFLSVAGHKLYAPQGIGSLYIRKGIEIEPLHHGAGHEGGRRGGTEAVPAIIGLGAAAALAQPPFGNPEIRALRNRLHTGLVAKLGDDLVLLGSTDDRLPNTLAVGFRGCIGIDVLTACPDLCATTGAACHADVREPSAVLKAMQVPNDVAFGAVRFSVGRYSTEAEVDSAIGMVSNAVRQVKSVTAG